MAKAIQVIEVKVYTYVPNLNELEYKENGIVTLEQAMRLDKKDYESGEVTLDDLIPTAATTSTVWGIVGE